ncbi:Motile sperm domain-containing protein 2-like protein [Dinothrombium tinctorium]|uniref:Motile sperm domain-containing protein 2-like protein n=1 Tax=Dinothrombium tinctorium TaxID=1965070 RepID=A0A3S3P097_9ACAR|nr:Motile sperm domain-containing protein 2-like protein [Dinothrombium tinctorium]RWS02294.1 Motile sperm domain-containing protein 2-like protein [Dinothrombium tinctorium]RWS02304.1 Motile sperm domain-containing protein 2-like protein [Dinothrombium tinctorium]
MKMLRKLIKRLSSKSLIRNVEEYSLIAQIQESLLKMYEEQNDLFDELDVQNIIMNKVYLRRFFVRQNGNVPKTIDMIKEALIWRKEKNLPHITPSHAPREIYEVGAIIQHETDYDGNSVIYFRNKYAFITKETRECGVRLLLSLVYLQIENGLNNNKGWMVVNDFTDITMANCNAVEALSVFRIYNKYTPEGLRKVIFYNVPWFAKHILKSLASMLPSEWRKIIHIVDKGSLHKFIPPENIPSFITNPAVRFQTPYPPDVKDIDHSDLELIGVKPEDKAAFKAFFDKLLKE